MNPLWSVDLSDITATHSDLLLELHILRLVHLHIKYSTHTHQLPHSMQERAYGINKMNPERCKWSLSLSLPFKLFQFCIIHLSAIIGNFLEW